MSCAGDARFAARRPSPGWMLEGLSSAFDDVLRRGLAKEPHERTASASQLRIELLAAAAKAKAETDPLLKPIDVDALLAIIGSLTARPAGGRHGVDVARSGSPAHAGR